MGPMNHALPQELALLLSGESDHPLVNQCINCDYETVFISHAAKHLLGHDKSGDPDDLSAYLTGLDTRISSLALDLETCLQTMTIGICLLNAFLQVNYTGPALSDKSSMLLPQSLLQLPREILYGAILDELVVDGERPYPLAEDLVYLLLASKILNHTSLHDLSSQAWWRIRVNFVHQKLLDDPVSSIHNIICDEETVERIEGLISADTELQSRWHLELAHYYSYYSYDQKAMFQVKEAQRVSELRMQVSGALGRRTKFQTFDVSQLVVLAKSTNSRKEHSASTMQHEIAPVSLALNDDILLESVSFTNTNEEASYAVRYISPRAEIVSQDALLPELAALDPGDQPQLSIVDQCILLAYAGVIKLSAASDDQIIIEQVAAYIARVLHTPIDTARKESNWTVNSAALLARTRVEGHRSRTVERSVLQLQALVDQLIDEIGMDKSLPRVGHETSTGGSDDKAAQSFLRRADQAGSALAVERLSHLFCLPLVSKWNMQTELAQKYTSIGLVRSALEIFQRLELWEQVALCYGAMDAEDKAESVLREQLKLAKPGSDMAKLWCLLGDVNGDPEYWQKSWEVSNHHYARAQRSLGKYYFGQKDFTKTLEAYAISLKINPLNHGAWFMYGCAGLETSQFEVAAEAFTRCISIDHTDGESWNNLASSLLRMGKDRKRDAWKALKTATNLKFESWRMWENYMLVSLDILEYGEVVRAMRRVIEIRTDVGESAIDIDVLRMLIQEVIGETLSEDDQELRGLPRMVNDLMVKVIQPLITHDPRLWKLLAKLYIWRKKYAEALEAHEKAYRCLTGKMIETELPVFEEAVEAVEELTDAYRSLGPMEGRMGGEVAKDWRFKGRSVLRTLKGRGSNFEDTTAYQKLLDLLEDLKS